MPKREQMVGKEYPVVPPGHDRRGRAFDNIIFFTGVFVVGAIFAGLWQVVVPFYSRPYPHFEGIPIINCEYTATVHTWLDRNLNKVWDAGEPPLHQVALEWGGIDDDTITRIFTFSEGPGITRLSAQASRCPNARLAVSAICPTGFTATTPLVYTLDSIEPVDIYFGFTDVQFTLNIDN